MNGSWFDQEVSDILIVLSWIWPWLPYIVGAILLLTAFSYVRYRIEDRQWRLPGNRPKGWEEEGQ